MARRQAGRPARICPKCRAQMRVLLMEGVQVDLCPLCMGMWFDAGELSRAAGLRFDAAATGAALAGARRTRHRCLSCTAPLYEREIGSGVLVDQCVRCSGLFVDHGEFSRIRRHYGNSGAPPRLTRPDRASASAGPRELDADSFGAELFQYLVGLPLELDTPQTLFPPVVTVLVAANVLAFVLAWVNGLGSATEAMGLVPLEIASGRRLWTLLTCMFMHGGVLHLLGNMYFLYIAGDNVEERLGMVRFTGFYLLCGLVAGLAHVVGNMASELPCVGASGAVSGVLGAYMVLFPHVRFRVRHFYFLWRHVVFDIPAWGYLGFWLLMQFFFAALAVPGVAWWAHVGGFACGAGIAVHVRLRQRRQAPGPSPARH